MEEQKTLTATVEDTAFAFRMFNLIKTPFACFRRDQE